MKQRTTIHLILSFAVAVMLVICGTAFQTNYSPHPQDWLLAHTRAPLLWLLDFTAFYTLLLMATLARARRRLHRQAEELYVMREEHNKQLGTLVARAAELDAVSDQQAGRIEQLEVEAQAHQEAYETEARRLVEQMFRSLQGQIEAHARQLDAVNMALQYHRAEISELRHKLRSPNGAPELPSAARLSPAEPAAISEALPALASPPTSQEPPASHNKRTAVTVVETKDPHATNGTSPPPSSPETSPEADSLSVGLPENVQALTENDAAIFDPTANARSTYILDTAEFDVVSTVPSGQENE